MKNNNRIISVILPLLLTGLFLASPAEAQWKILKKFVKKDIAIEKETEKQLVLYSKSLDQRIQLGQYNEGDYDIYCKLTQKRGGNPYRVWVATERFMNQPKKIWGKFFRAEFLKNLRKPGASVKVAQYK